MTTPTERRLAITPGANPKVSEPLVTDARINVLSSSVAAARCAIGTDLYTESNLAWRLGVSHFRDLYEAEFARLRQERDELVGALEEIRNVPLFANSDAEHVFTVQRIAKAILSKHKPE